MSVRHLVDLAAVIDRDRDALLSRWRSLVRELPSAEHLDTPTLNDHIPVLLDELTAALRAVSDESIPEALVDGSPPVHGVQRHQDGYDIAEVVAEYNILRGCVHDLAEANRVALRGRSFHILNRVFDESIGLAVQAFATTQALEVRRRREEYLAFVAHDLRSPLNAVALAAGVLEVKLAGADDPTLTKMVKSLRRNVKALESLVDRVLKENANLEAGPGVTPERRDVDVWPLVEAVVRDLQPVADTAAGRLINAVPDDLTAYADAGLLSRVFQNLIANAISYTPRGEVTVSARPTGTGGVECRVSDTGAGIPADRLDRVFDKGETDPDRPGGLGLGLAIVKSFVEAHGGTVSVVSTVGVGSTFRFTVPGRPPADKSD